MKFPETARRLSEAMNDKNIKAVELAEKAGITKGSVSQYLNGRNRPTNINAGKMADVLGVDAMWLMGFDVPKHTEDRNPIIDYIAESGLAEIIAEAKMMDDETTKNLLAYARFLNHQRKEEDGNVDRQRQTLRPIQGE